MEWLTGLAPISLIVLLCPLLMWAPIRYQDRSFDSLSSARRGDD